MRRFLEEGTGSLELTGLCCCFSLLLFLLFSLVYLEVDLNLQ